MRLGRRSRLSDEQLGQVGAALLAGPKVHGFATDMWTLARVADVIERVTAVRYSPTQTCQILRQRLDWTRQRPARRAVERDDAAIGMWVKQDWPRIKRGYDDPAPGSASGTRADSPSLPVVRGTWAPRGQTPVLRHRFSWTHMSMAGVLAYRPGRSRAKRIFQTKVGSYTTDSLIEFSTSCAGTCAASPSC